jgi:hypothetical protein
LRAPATGWPAKLIVTNSCRELFEAMCRIAESGKGPAEQQPSMGCGALNRSRMSQQILMHPTPCVLQCCQSPCSPLSADRSKSRRIFFVKMHVCERALTFSACSIA